LSSLSKTTTDNLINITDTNIGPDQKIAAFNNSKLLIIASPIVQSKFISNIRNLLEFEFIQLKLSLIEENPINGILLSHCKNAKDRINSSIVFLSANARGGCILPSRSSTFCTYKRQFFVLLL